MVLSSCSVECRSGDWGRAVGTFLSGLILATLLCCFTNAPASAQSTSGKADHTICELLTIEGAASVLVAPSTNWVPARIGQVLHEGDLLRTEKESRATVRLSGLCVLRVNEQTLFGVHPPQEKGKKPLFDLKSGSVFFYSREKPTEIKFRTPTASGAIRGTEFLLRADQNGSSEVALLDGQVDLENESGVLHLNSGENGSVQPGLAPIRTPLLDAASVIQWCLYYPAVVDLSDIHFPPEEMPGLENSLAAYKAGDLLSALSLCPEPDRASSASRVYRAALELSVGRVDRATNLLASVSQGSSPAPAIQRMIFTVRNQAPTETNAPVTASEWMSESYRLQSRGQLEQALAASRVATSNAPQFGFAWVRLAELEFSLGNIKSALSALKRGLELSPRNAQAHSLSGFVLASQNQNDQAMAAFNRAIELDGGLGTAWLGRGLCRIRNGDRDGGRADLQVAAVLEPQRAVIRSYLGKAFQHDHMNALARKELRLAKQLDPNDPTAWLYSGLLNQQDNQLNDAILDLKESQARNDNQRLFRSRFQLDQDQAVRQANQAVAYRDAGMLEFGSREAARAVETDYADPAGHTFLAYTYLAHRDLVRYDDRFASTLDNEWLIARLLSPAGSYAFSKNISIREYEPFFVTDGFGFGSSTEYLSRGAWREVASQYGRKGNLDYSVDFGYETDPGVRVNNRLEQTRVSAQTRIQVNERDSVFFYAEQYHYAVGDIAQYYDQNQARPTYHASQTGLPLLLGGFHREWNPHSHTLLLLSGMHNDLKVSAQDAQPLFLYYWNNSIYRVNPPFGAFVQNYDRVSDIYSADLQQILQASSHTLVLGGRVQVADYHVASHLSERLNTNINQNVRPDLLRLSLYGYDHWKIFEPLQLTLGGSLERFDFPANIDTAPVRGNTTTKERFLPKAGLIYTPFSGTTLRAHYTRSLGSACGEDQIRIEPTVVGGINQTFSQLFPSSVAGLVSGSDQETWAVALDQSLTRRTFLGIEGSILSSRGSAEFGTLTNGDSLPFPDRPTSVTHKLKFQEKGILLSLNQLIDRDWSVGLDDRLSHSHLEGWFPQIPANAIGANGVLWDESAVLNQVRFHLNFNHPCGFYALFETLWTQQFNYDTPGVGSSTFFQHNIFAGYRFLNRRAEAQVGIYNLTDRDYRLNPLSFYEELPRERTFAASLKLNF